MYSAVCTVQVPPYVYIWSLWRARVYSGTAAKAGERDKLFSHFPPKKSIVAPTRQNDFDLSLGRTAACLRCAQHRIPRQSGLSNTRSAGKRIHCRTKNRVYGRAHCHTENSTIPIAAEDRIPCCKMPSLAGKGGNSVSYGYTAVYWRNLGGHTDPKRPTGRRRDSQTASHAKLYRFSAVTFSPETYTFFTGGRCLLVRVLLDQLSPRVSGCPNP